MSKKVRTIALTVIILAGGVGLWYIWTNYGSKPSAEEAPALSKQASGRILLDGAVVPDKSADLGFINPATITAITKKVGDVVKSGEILATQKSDDIRAEVGAAQATLQGAQAGLDKLNHDLKKERLKLYSFSGNARTQQKEQVSSSKDSVAAQKSAVVAAQDGVVSAQAQLAKTVLSPFDGIIARQDGEVGEVSGVYSPPFMTVASDGPLQKIEAFASDLDVAKIKTGDSAQVTFDVAGAQKTIPAKVSAIDPAPTQNNGKLTYKITLLLENTDADLRAGMHASVSF